MLNKTLDIIRGRIHNSTDYVLSTYFDSNDEPKYMNNGYVSKGAHCSEFYVSSNYRVNYNGPLINGESIDLVFVPDEKYIEILYVKEHGDGEWNNWGSDIGSLLFPVFSTEEEYFQYITVEEHPFTFEEITVLYTFFQDCLAYAQKVKDAYYAEYLQACRQ